MKIDQKLIEEKYELLATRGEVYTCVQSVAEHFKNTQGDNVEKTSIGWCITRG